MADIVPNSSVNHSSIPVGGSVNLTWNGSADLGIYFYEGSIQKPGGSFHTFTRRFQSANPLPLTEAYTDIPEKGVYTWTSRYADHSIAFVGPGLLGIYFNDTTLTTPVLYRADSTVDFDWGTGSPDPVVNPDNFSVRWLGLVTPEFSETYTFKTSTDDGVRLWVNGVLIIDDWNVHPETANTGTIALTGGQAYDIKMEYFESSGVAAAHLSWSSASQPLQVIPSSRLSIPLTYGVGFIDEILTFTATGLTQSTPNISPGNSTIVEGTTLNFTASGGNGTGAYNWGGVASGTGTTKSILFDTPGVYTITVYRSGDTVYDDSTTRTVTITVTEITVATPIFTPVPGTYFSTQHVSIACSTPGATIRYTTDNSAPTSTHGTVYTGTIAVSSPTIIKAIAYKTSWFDSLVASGNFSVQPPAPVITPLSSTDIVDVPLNGTVNLTWNATATLGIAFYEGNVQLPDGTYVIFDRVFNPSFPVVQAFSTTSQRGLYFWTSRYADNSIGNPPLTNGTGFVDRILTFTVQGNSQAAVTIQPDSTQCFVGDTLTFFAFGGSGTGEYVWSGAGDGIGSTKDVTFTLAGVYLVKLYRNGDLTYDQSNTVSATVTVFAIPVNQPTFSPIPGTYSSSQLVTIATTTPGASIRYTLDNSVPTALHGTLYTTPVLLDRLTTLRAIAFKTNSPDSNVKTGVYDIPPPPPIVNIDATTLVGTAPLSTTISWSALNATNVVVSGPNLSSAAFTGSKNFPNLDVGSYTFSILAFNGGGSTLSSITVSAISNKIDFFIFGTKTAHFFDRTIYKADQWLWDFGDGNTSTEQNPVHTYGFDGVFVVKLTAYCDGKPSTIIHTVSVSGCFTGDPLPFTPDWDTLINEEVYPPYTETRFSSDTNELGFVASREGQSNENWSMCSYVDWCYGPAVIGTTEYRYKTRWTIYLDPTAKTWQMGKGGLTQPVPTNLLPETLSNPSYFNNVNFVSLAFDTSAQLFVAFQKGINQVQVRWMVGATLHTSSFTGITPKLFSECNIQPAVDLCDVIVYYLKDDGVIYFRFQRENFSVEHAGVKPTSYGSELATITKVDDIRINDIRRIYLYGFTLGHRNIVLESGQYPLFPSDTPTSGSVPPEFATETTTIETGNYYPTAFIEFTGESTTLENGYTLPGPNDSSTQTTNWEVGSHTAPDRDFGGQVTTLVSGALSIQVDASLQTTGWDSGSHLKPERDYGFNSTTLTSGYTTLIVNKAISQLGLDQGGSHTKHVDFMRGTLSLDTGSHAAHLEKVIHSFTLDTGSHAVRQEKTISRQTLDKAKHQQRTDGSAITITVDGANHRDAQETPIIATTTFSSGVHRFDSQLFLRGTINSNFTLDYGSHARGDTRGSIALDFTLDRGSYTQADAALLGFRYTLESGSHEPPASNFLTFQPTISNGSHAQPDARIGTSLISLSSGVHYFQLLTFDYIGTDPTVLPEQDDHWDSTVRTFDLDISVQPDIA